jgi:hypothetical protein
MAQPAMKLHVEARRTGSMIPFRYLWRSAASEHWPSVDGKVLFSRVNTSETRAGNQIAVRGTFGGRSTTRRHLAHLDRFRLADNLVAGKLASGNGHEGTRLSQRKE